jgi:hypothetical protein
MTELLQLAADVRRRRAKRVAKKLWSRKVKTHWHPPAGFFERPASAVARGLLRASKTPGQAVKRLTFYINRAGKNLSTADRARLHRAVRMIEAKLRNARGA